jgi:WD40 repeat protein
MKAKRPADRYPTPAAAAALAPFAAGASAGSPRRLRRRLVFAAALGIVALAAWGVFATLPDYQPDAVRGAKQPVQVKPRQGPPGEPAARRQQPVPPPDLIALVGHRDGVNAVAFSADGRLAASAGGRYRERLRGRPADYEVRVWDVKNRRLRRRPPGHTDAVQHVVFATGGRHLVSGGRDGVLRVWDIEGGRTAAQARPGRIWGLAVFPGGRRALSVTESALQVWDLPGLTERQRWQDPPDYRFCAALSPKGNHGVTAGGKMDWQSGRPLPGADYAVWLWDAATGQPLHRFEGHSLTVWGAVFSPDGRKIFSGGADGSIRGWDVYRREPLPLWAGHPRVVSLAVSPRGRLLVSAGNDGTLRLWDLTAGKEVKRLDGGLGVLHQVAWSPDGRHILFGGDQGLKLWRLSADNHHG